METSKRDAALLEAASKIPHRGALSVVCGAIVEAGEPTGAVNLQVRLQEINRMAVEILRAKRERR